MGGGRMNGPLAFSSWSGGKDSCLALHRALRGGARVTTLLTMFDESGERSRSHAIPRRVARAQAEAMGLELVTVAASWASYEAAFVDALRALRSSGIELGVFGDIDLAPNRAWEERTCAAAGLVAALPLWGEARRALVDEFLDLGFQAIVVCVDGAKLPPALVGRRFDRAFLADLPPGVDACGENGEFHTFVFDGPLFSRPVRLAPAEPYARSAGDRTLYYQPLVLDGAAGGAGGAAGG